MPNSTNTALLEQIQQAFDHSESTEAEFKEALLTCLQGRTGIQATIDRLAALGWTRRKFYLATYLVINDDSLTLSEPLFDCIDNFLTSIDGYCSPEVILQIPGEDVGGDLTTHARSRKWLEQ